VTAVLAFHAGGLVFLSKDLPRPIRVESRFREVAISKLQALQHRARCQRKTKICALFFDYWRFEKALALPRGIEPLFQP
jgi:hypothetical protein